MPCLVALSAHWAMKGNSTWIRSLYLIYILKKHSNIVIRKEWLWSPTDFFVTFLLVFFLLDLAQRSKVFLPFWTWGCRGDHFGHFVRRHWHIDDSSGLGRCYLLLSLKLTIMLNWMHLDVLVTVLIETFLFLDRNHNCCDNTMIKHMHCLVALSAHWAMKGNSTWMRSLYLILNIVIKVEWLRGSTNNFVMFLLVFFFTWPCTTFNSIPTILNLLKAIISVIL